MYSITNTSIHTLTHIHVIMFSIHTYISVRVFHQFYIIVIKFNLIAITVEILFILRVVKGIHITIHNFDRYTYMYSNTNTSIFFSSLVYVYLDIINNSEFFYDFLRSRKCAIIYKRFHAFSRFLTFYTMEKNCYVFFTFNGILIL